MRRIVLILFTGLLVFSTQLNARGGSKYDKGKKKTSRRSIKSETQVLSSLSKIEATIPSDAKVVLPQLEYYVKFSIQNDYQESLSKSYWLLGKAYKELGQSKLALKYLNLAEATAKKAEAKKDKIAFEKVAVKEKSEKIVVREKSIEPSSNYSKGKKRDTKSADLSDEAIEEEYEEIAAPSISGTSYATDENASLRKNEYTLNTLPKDYYKDRAEVEGQLKNYDESNGFYESYKLQVESAEEKEKIDYIIAQNLYADKQYEAAIKAYNLLLESAKQQNDKEKIAACESRIAACYISMGKTEEGLNIYSNSAQSIGSYSQGDQIDLERYSENKEVVTQALRDQKKFKEEADLRSEAASITNDGLEYLKLAESYAENGDDQAAQEAIDEFLENPSYEIPSEEEIEVLKDQARNLKESGNTVKAYEYLDQHQKLADSISFKTEQAKKQSLQLNEAGYENVLDIEMLQKDKEISDSAIRHLMRESKLREDVVGFQKTLIYVLCLVIILGIGTTFYVARIAKQRRLANQQLAIRSLRSQMNPHFIFNALNSVNSFISLNDEKAANKFLSEFSTLMRAVMENSEHDFIPLNKELEIIELYLGLEHFRFKDKFDYDLKVDEDMDEDDFKIPPMLVQPYIENAIWHGLRYKEELGHLTVSFKQENGHLLVTIKDDGIGRKQSAALKTKNQKKSKSTAIRNINQRIDLLNNVHNIKIQVEINDVNEDGTGTEVRLKLPPSISKH